jgi:arylsulfatase A-like enzyme
MVRRLLDSPPTYFAAAGILLLVALATQFELRLPSRPQGTVEDIATLRDRDDLNVVFILVDTLRADRMGVYGYERPTTPVLDDLAAHGIVFERVIAQSAWTKTSMASLWTATYPNRNGILRYNHVVPAEAVMPAEIFKEAGYLTAGIWRNGWTAPNFGFAQGFDLYHQPKPGSEQKLQRHSPAPRPIEGTDEDLAVSARDFLDNFGQRRFFLYLHLMDLHQYIFDEFAEEFGPSYSDAYDKSIDWTDRVIGTIVQALDDAGALQRTVIVVASDHGEAFEEHGFEGHARNLYREVVEVPLIIIPPVILEEGIRVDTLVANVDLWPTVLDLVGLPPLPEGDGRSMVPLILQAGGAASHPPIAGLARPVVTHMDKRWGSRGVPPEEIVSLMDGQSKVFVHRFDATLDEFYDTVADPGEQQNLHAKRPPQLAPLLEQVDRYLENDSAPWGVGPGEIELDAMRLNQLKALGYHIGN